MAAEIGGVACVATVYVFGPAVNVSTAAMLAVAKEPAVEMPAVANDAVLSGAVGMDVCCAGADGNVFAAVTGICVDERAPVLKDEVTMLGLAFVAAVAAVK